MKIDSEIPHALYVHIPFCAARCPYCDFNTYAGMESSYAPYIRALIVELREAAVVAHKPVIDTIFVGGGTPTVLPAQLYGSIFACIRDAYRLDPFAEITSEANPGTLDQEQFVALRSAGVNRLSMGVQSFDDAELRWLGRIHNAAEARAAFAAAREAGFDDINLDFMFGLPGQDPVTWRRTLDQACSLRPEHLSLYSLTVEAGTPLAREVDAGRQSGTDDDLAAELYDIAGERLEQAGYVHYEISNWALPGHQCRHNLVYWRNEPYIGAGAGAHGYQAGTRQWNVGLIPAYLARLSAGRSAMAGSEEIDDRLAMGETMMLGLRLLQEGVSYERFFQRHGIDLRQQFRDEIGDLIQRDLVELLDDRIRLTQHGWLLGNQVFGAFLPDS